MIFEEYYKKYRIYKRTTKEVNDLDNKRINLMSMVGLQSPSTDNAGGNNSQKDKMALYVAELEAVESNLLKKKKIIEEIKLQLKEKEEDLRESKEILDKVYLYKYVDNLKYYQIGTKIGYEKSKTYNLINEVDEILKKIKLTEKNGKI